MHNAHKPVSTSLAKQATVAKSLLSWCTYTATENSCLLFPSSRQLHKVQSFSLHFASSGLFHHLQPIYVHCTKLHFGKNSSGESMDASKIPEDPILWGPGHFSNPQFPKEYNLTLSDSPRSPPLFPEVHEKTCFITFSFFFVEKWYSKASRYTASSCMDHAGARFWIGSKKNWNEWIYAVKTLSSMVFWPSCLHPIK